MWKLYRTAKSLSQRPSRLAGERDPWAAYQLDSAVVAFGIVVENALDERVQIGSGANAQWEPKYTLAQMMDPGFHLPAPKTARDREREALQGFKAWAAKTRGARLIKV